MKKILIMIVILLSSFTFVHSTSAAYDSTGDIQVNVNLLKGSLVFSDKTGDATFKLQEDVHKVLKSATGLEINHSYAWVNINGYKILAIDPPKPCF